MIIIVIITITLIIIVYTYIYIYILASRLRGVEALPAAAVRPQEKPGQAGQLLGNYH